MMKMLIEIIKQLNHEGYNAYYNSINKDLIQVSIFKNNALLIRNYVLKQEAEIMNFIELLRRENIYTDVML